MGVGKANLFALICLVPAILLILVPYINLWPEQFSKESIKSYLDAREMLTIFDYMKGIFIVLLGVMGHELLHGLGWMFYAKKRWQSIKFGINWKFLTPYCHCNEPLRLSAYRFGSLLPGIVLGIIPSALAMIIGNLWLLAFGFFFTFAAGGDFLMLWLLRHEKSSNFIQDHPEKIGCSIVVS